MDLAPLGPLDLAPLSVLQFACCPRLATPPPACQKLHDEDSADVFSIVHVLVALIDALQRIGPGYHPVEVQLPVFVQVQQHRHVGAGVDRAEDAADESPAAATRTSTSPARGGSSSISSTCQSVPAPYSTAACVRILSFPCPGPSRSRRFALEVVLPFSRA